MHYLNRRATCRHLGKGVLLDLTYKVPTGAVINRIPVPRLSGFPVGPALVVLACQYIVPRKNTADNVTHTEPASVLHATELQATAIVLILFATLSLANDINLTEKNNNTKMLTQTFSGI